MKTDKPIEAKQEATTMVSPEERARRKRIRELNSRLEEIRTEIGLLKTEIDELRSLLKRPAKDNPDHGKLLTRLNQIADEPKKLRDEANILREEKRRLKEMSESAETARP